LTKWRKFEVEYSDLIEKEGLAKLFEDAYKGTQSLEWNTFIRTASINDQMNAAILTLFNQEISDNERQRRWKSLPASAKKWANTTVKKEDLSRRRVWWRYECESTDIYLPDEMAPLTYIEWQDRFNENQTALSDLPAVCVKAQQQKTIDWIEEQKAQASKDVKRLRELCCLLPSQRTLRDSSRRAYQRWLKNFQISKARLEGVRKIREQEDP
jgi:hypothetical protein